MSRTPFVIILFTACTARADRPIDHVAPLSDQAVLEAFEQHTLRVPSFQDDVDSNIERYPTLQAMLSAHTGEKGCDGSCPLTTLVHERVPATATAPEHWPALAPIDEVMVVGAQTRRVCQWFIAAHTTEGWLEPIHLGSSGKGCRVALDDGALEFGGKLWFPLHVDVKGRDLRIEAQTLDASDTFEIWDDPKAVATIPRQREVILCRLHIYGPGTLACATATEDGAPLSGNAAAVFATQPLTTGTTRLPLTDAVRLGHELPAQWFIAPIAASAKGQRLGRLPEMMSRYAESKVTIHPLGDGLPTVLTGGETPSIFLLDKGRVTHIASHYPNYANDELQITRVERTPGLVRIDLELVSHGATSVTWRWTELITATHHARLATGVEIRIDDQRLTGWERLVTADRDGVVLRAGRGELAWFRGTGRFTWDELATATQRWLLAFARAWEPTRAEPTRPADSKRLPSKEAIGYLVTIPGFAEPAHRLIHDMVRPLQRSK